MPFLREFLKTETFKSCAYEHQIRRNLLKTHEGLPSVSRKYEKDEKRAIARQRRAVKVLYLGPLIHTLESWHDGDLRSCVGHMRSRQSSLSGSYHWIINRQNKKRMA